MEGRGAFWMVVDEAVFVVVEHAVVVVVDEFIGERLKKDVLISQKQLSKDSSNLQSAWRQLQKILYNHKTPVPSGPKSICAQKNSFSHFLLNLAQNSFI